MGDARTHVPGSQGGTEKAGPSHGYLRQLLRNTAGETTVKSEVWAGEAEAGGGQALLAFDSDILCLYFLDGRDQEGVGGTRPTSVPPGGRGGVMGRGEGRGQRTVKGAQELDQRRQDGDAEGRDGGTLRLRPVGWCGVSQGGGTWEGSGTPVGAVDEDPGSSTRSGA